MPGMGLVSRLQMEAPLGWTRCRLGSSPGAVLRASCLNAIHQGRVELRGAGPVLQGESATIAPWRPPRLPSIPHMASPAQMATSSVAARSRGRAYGYFAQQGEHDHSERPHIRRGRARARESFRHAHSPCPRPPAGRGGRRISGARGNAKIAASTGPADCPVAVVLVPSEEHVGEFEISMHDLAAGLFCEVRTPAQEGGRARVRTRRDYATPTFLLRDTRPRKHALLAGFQRHVTHGAR